jgi:hypothetical protein
MGEYKHQEEQKKGNTTYMVAKEKGLASDEATEGAQAPVVPVQAGWHDVTYESAVKMCIQEYGQVVSALDVVGDGFMKMEKSECVNRQFLIVDYQFHTDADTQREYVTLRCVNPINQKFFFNDGSTGVYQQMKTLYARGIHGGIICETGLRVSEYVYENDKGEKSQARTYYIASS